MPAASAIPQLHALYVRETGLACTLTLARERDWFEWLRFHDPAWSGHDLLSVISHLRAAIRQGERNPGALKFHNLIGQPDYFEEDWSLARASARPRPRAHEDRTTRDPHGTTTRRVARDPGTCAAQSAGQILTPEKIAAEICKMRKASE